MDIGNLWNTGVVGSFVWALSQVFAGLSGIGIPSWGLAIIAFTIIVRLIMVPLSLQQIRSQKMMVKLQPQLSALQKQHGKDREKLMQAQMALYKEHHYNPAAGCLPTLLQMPIWIGLYSALYELAQHESFKQAFLWLPNLALPEPAFFNGQFWGAFPAIPFLALLTGATQWVVGRMMAMPTADPSQKTMQQAMQFMPLMFIVFAFSVPSGLVLYWVASNIFTMIQQYFTNGWGLLIPTKDASKDGKQQPVRAALAAAPLSEAQAKVDSAIALPEPAKPNGHVEEPGVVQRAVTQVPPSTRRRRRRK